MTTTTGVGLLALGQRPADAVLLGALHAAQDVGDHQVADLRLVGVGQVHHRHRPGSMKPA